MTHPSQKISGQTVRADFNSIESVLHYTRAAHALGLWESERRLIAEFLPEKTSRILEAGCGAGRVSIALAQLGYRKITAFDFAEELIEQAQSFARERGLDQIEWLHADAVHLRADLAKHGEFHGAIFAFNGLMQIPGRENRRAALRNLHAVCATGAPLIFTTHDRDESPRERALWSEEAKRWAAGKNDPQLVEFGDRYFTHENGQTFMHLPVRTEILEDLTATGWSHVRDAMRREIAAESRAVRDFSDECRFWVARK